MKIIKRNGMEVTYDIMKIINAIQKANQTVPKEKQLSASQIQEIADHVKKSCEKSTHTVTVEEVQDMVENQLMLHEAFEIARNYITYRYTQMLKRTSNTTDDKILSLIECNNEEVKQENSNKNPIVVSVQRDYMAGEVSKDLTMRLLLPQKVVKAHQEGILHFHDSDYYSQKMHNCCLVNLDDMLQNGTVISETMIEKPHRFSTACNIATQIIAQVASSQYGGQSITLTHLAPFVNESRMRIRQDLLSELAQTGVTISEEQISRMVEMRLKKEIKAGVQTIQYQVVTLMTTNGQAPFITVFMYLGEARNAQEKEDLAMIIEETLNQRIQGVKNEKGIWITPAFPKLIYVLEEDNITKDAPYWYLTELAAKCTAKRMVPDYISEKKMREYKLSKGETPGNGDTYPCMGCVESSEVITYRINGYIYTEAFYRMWTRMSDMFGSKIQPGRKDDEYIDLVGIDIYDNVTGWTKCKRIIRNNHSKLLRLKFNNGRTIECTPDHPFETVNRGVVKAESLTCEDIIEIDKESAWIDTDSKLGNEDIAWLYGVLLCDSSYDKTIVASFAAKGEDDIISEFQRKVSENWNLNTKSVLRERERKGTYYDIMVQSDGTSKVCDIISHLIHLFVGIKKADRHIPNEVFNWSKEARLLFLAGMIDADGYVNDNLRMSSIQIGSTNKELALQQMHLAQTLGMRASVYQNHYKGKGRYDTIRYHVTFYPTLELINCLVSMKKKMKYQNTERINNSISNKNIALLVSREDLDGYHPSYDVTTESEHFTVSGMYSHNCRSFLTPDSSGNGFDNIANALNYIPNEPKYYGRFNQGVVTINLVDVALSSGGDTEQFWKIFDERLELCHTALMCRHNRLKGTLSDASPIHWQYGALARLKKGEPIDKLLYNGYSTISLGYAGLYECVKYMTGASHTDESATPFALSVMQYMNDKCAEWKEKHHIDFSLYGTPLESTTYKFAKCLQNRFGIIEGITDRNYITNSYHVPVFEEIDAFTKLGFESKFQRLSPGGAISYVEVPNMQNNIPAVLSVIQYIYDNIMYAELNTKSDYCHECGFNGEIQIVEDDGKLIWECPNCGNRNQDKMNVARRTCGYIGTQFWNQGRTQEIKDRVLHL